MSTSLTSVNVHAPHEQAEGTRSQILRWLRSVGDTVRENEPLIEIETDKVTVEVSAPVGGVLREILKREQEEITAGETLGRIDVGAGINELDDAPVAAAAVVQTAAVSARSLAATGARRARMSAGLSPAVKRLLEERELRAEQVVGTGPGGRISVDDVLRSEAKPAPVPASVPALMPGAEAGRRLPHTAARRRIAERMVQSLLHTAPHVTTLFEADFSAVLAHRAQHRQAFEAKGVALTVTAYLLAACVDAIRAVPEVNARWHDDSLELFDQINIGVATATEDKRLIVPVVRAVQELDLFGIASHLADLVSRGRENRLSPQDVRGATFTISNHGVSGSLVAMPIVINQPQVAILGVGKLERRPVVVERDAEERIVVQPRCYLTLTIDHRALDGQHANRFLEVLVDRLQQWSQH